MRISSLVSFLMLAVPAFAVTCKDLGKEVIDKNCTEAFPICVYANGGQVVGGNVGHHCALCINSKYPNRIAQVAPDEGCDEEYRVCAGKRQLAANVEGTACVVCSNSIPTTIDPSDIDDGCPPTANVCVDDAGNSPALYAPGTKCVAKCIDTKISGTDKGCTKRFPNCVLDDGSDPGTGLAGTKCDICSPAACDDNDPCTDDSCDAEGNCVHEDNGSCSCGEVGDWKCDGVPITQCTDYPLVNSRACYCDVDLAGDPFCWRDRLCEGILACTSNDDCGPNQKCASTCCGAGHCLDDCALTETNNLRVSVQEVEVTGPFSSGL